MAAKSALRGDVSGGLTAALLSVPASMGYGLLALAPLGEGYVTRAALAGIYSALLVPAVALLLGARAPVMYAPRSVVAFLVGSLAWETLRGIPVTSGPGLEHAAFVVFLLLFLAALAQALFGALGIGTLIKYIPSPVMAGFQNAVAVLLLMSQMHTMLGVPRAVPLSRLPLASIQPATLAVGVLTCLVIWLSPRVTRRLPPLLAGILVGTAGYHAVALLAPGLALGPVVGDVPVGVPDPRYLLEFVGALATPSGWKFLGMLAGPAISLAIVASLDALLCAKTVQTLTGERAGIGGSRDLFRLGAGNLVAACFGAIPAGVNLAASSANHRAGGRTVQSVIVATAAIGCVGIFLGPIIGLLPRVVIAATLVMVSIQLVDRWSLRLAARVAARHPTGWRMALLDLLVVALVASVTIALDLVAAVATGVVVAVLFFLLRMSRSVVRRTYRGDVVRSRRARDPQLMAFLSVAGRRLVVFELEGPLFFGTAENLAQRIEQAVGQDAHGIVLDFRRVSDVDSTGAHIVLQLRDRLRRDGRHLLVSHVQDNPALAAALQAVGGASVIGPGSGFPDTDTALEHAEDLLIAAERADLSLPDELPADRLCILEGLAPRDLAQVTGLLVRRTYGPGEVVIREGDRDRSLFMIARGRASVKITLPGRARDNRLATFSAGTIFGEMALLDGQPRSATVTADEDLVCHVLSGEAFDALTATSPHLAVHLLRNLGRELSQRLRKSTAMIAELER